MVVVYVGFVAPLISVHVIPSGLLCHCREHVPAPPVGLAVSVTAAPTQMVLAEVLMVTLGIAVTTTVAVVDVKLPQLLLLSVMIIL